MTSTHSDLRSHPVRRRRPCHAAGGARPDDPGDRAADHRRRSGAAVRRVLGGDGLRRRGGRDDAVVGQAGRPPRPQADARAVAGDVPGGVRRLRAGDGHRHAGRLPRGARRGRGRADEPRHGGGRRPGVAARARPLPGLHRLRVRGCDHRRPAGRRAAGRPCVLALGVLREPAAGDRGTRRPAPAAAGARAGAGDRTARRSRRGAAGGRHQLPDAGLHLGRRPLRLDLPRDRRAGRRRRRVRHRAGGARAAGRRSGRPARAAADAHRRRRVGRAVPGHRRAVRGQRVRPAVPADNDRRVPHRGRPAAGAGHARHHRLDVAGRAGDR